MLGKTSSGVLPSPRPSLCAGSCPHSPPHSSPSTRARSKVERPLDGTGPWSLGEGLTVYLTPGHTEGHAVLFYAPDAALLAGDHLFLSRRLGRLAISITHNWYSLPRQLESVAELVDLPVRHVLPGHGRPMHFASAGEYRAAALEVLRCDGQWDDGRLRAVGGRTRELQV